MIMRKFKFIGVFLLSLLLSTAAQAHAFLDHASPGVGSTVASSPGQVTLYFTQQLEPKFSGAEVRNAPGARVDRGKTVSGNVMRISVSALPVDTHTTQGSFSFRVGG
jgi:copper resistance protein C